MKSARVGADGMTRDSDCGAAAKAATVPYEGGGCGEEGEDGCHLLAVVKDVARAVCLCGAGLAEGAPQRNRQSLLESLL